MDETTELPAALRAAWGLVDRPGKGPKPGLSLERVVAAGIAVADAEGIAALSMSRVAKQLGASTMSLYRYVTAKDELVALMFDTAIGPPPASRPDDDWRTGLARWAKAMFDGFLGHPWTVDLPIRGLPTMPNEVAWTEAALHAMRDNGLTNAERMSVLLLVAGYVRNHATTQVQIAVVFAVHESPDQAMAHYARTLTTLVDPDRFPELTSVLSSGVLDQADGPDDEFHFGLSRILDGVAEFIGSRTNG